MTDIIFKIYKKNMECYYNSRILLKIINDNISNIPSTMSNIIHEYETHPMKVRDYSSYISYLRLVKKALCNLFNDNKNRPNSDLKTSIEFDDYLSYINTRNMPTVSMPSVSIPSVSIPSVSMPSVSMPFNSKTKEQQLTESEKKQLEYLVVKYELYIKGISYWCNENSNYYDNSSSTSSSSTSS